MGPQGPAGPQGPKGDAGAPGNVPPGTIIFLPANAPAPQGYTYVGFFTEEVHVGPGGDDRDHDKERDRRNGREITLRLNVYRKN